MKPDFWVLKISLFLKFLYGNFVQNSPIFQCTHFLFLYQNKYRADSDGFLTEAPRIDQSNRLCSLSADRMNLGDILLHSPIRRIIFLQNRSTTTGLVFIEP